MSRPHGWAIGARATAAFGVGLATLLVLLVMSGLTIRNLAVAAREVSRAHEMRFQLVELVSAIQDVETGPRGLVLTRQDTFLEPYQRGISRIPVALAAVRALTATRPEQTRHLDATEPIITARVEFSRRTIEVYRNEGAAAAMALIQSGTGRALLGDVRWRLEDLGEQESRAATERQEESDAAVAATLLALHLGGGVAVAILLAVLWLLHHEARTRRQAEAVVRDLNASLEQRVSERTLRLEDANRELEAFSHSVSHDLRAPLRAIDRFSKILIEQHEAALPPKAREYLGLVQDGAMQMGDMINALLALSRLGWQPQQKSTVAPDELVRDCLQSLVAENSGRHVQVSIGELPACEADRGLLKLVWMNLLSNAFKFTGRRHDALIEIGCRGIGEAVYFVRDNGVGFNPASDARLFGVFQRLHSAADYEGTGVGLATARRIVQRHGGRMWAESGVNQGATFFFTLEPRRLS